MGGEFMIYIVGIHVHISLVNVRVNIVRIPHWHKRVHTTVDAIWTAFVLILFYFFFFCYSLLTLYLFCRYSSPNTFVALQI